MPYKFQLVVPPSKVKGYHAVACVFDKELIAVAQEGLKDFT